MDDSLSHRTGWMTVLIIDSCPLNRAGLRMVLETEPDVHVIGEASTVAEGLRILEQDRPCMVVYGLEHAMRDAPTATRQLVACHPACVIILLALLLDPATQSELLAAGATACVEKDHLDNFLKTFRTVRQR